MKLLVTLLFSFFLLSVSAQNRPVNRTEAQARQLIDSLYTLVKNGGDMSKLAMAYSDDLGSKAKGGLCLNVPYGRFLPEFDNEVVNLDAGGISKPFVTLYGYHIVQVLEKQPTAFTVRHILIKFRQ